MASRRASLIFVLLGVLAGTLWLRLDPRGADSPEGALESRVLGHLLEAKAADATGRAARAPEAPAELDRTVALAREALLRPRGSRALSLRFVALLAVRGELATATELAHAAGAPELARLLADAARSPRDGDPLGPDELDTVLAGLPVGGWLRAHLGAALAARIGSPAARIVQEERVGAARAHLVATTTAVVGSSLVAGLIGLALLALAPWRLGRWLARRPRRPLLLEGGPRTAAVVIVAWFGVFLASGLVLWPWLPASGVVFGQTLASGLAALTLVRWLAAPLGVSASLGFGRPLDRQAALWALGGAGVALPAVLALSLVVERIAPAEPPHVAISLLSSGLSTGGAALVVASVVLLAPVFEEALFRGYLYPVLRGVIGTGAAMAASGAVFAVCHLSPTDFLPLWALGALLALVREGAGTLWAPILCHALWNLGSLGRLWLILD